MDMKTVCTDMKIVCTDTSCQMASLEQMIAKKNCINTQNHQLVVGSKMPSAISIKRVWVQVRLEANQRLVGEIVNWEYIAPSKRWGIYASKTSNWPKSTKSTKPATEVRVPPLHTSSDATPAGARRCGCLLHDHRTVGIQLVNLPLQSVHVYAPCCMMRYGLLHIIIALLHGSVGGVAQNNRLRKATVFFGELAEPQKEIQ